MATQTAADFGTIPPRSAHVGTNRMHGTVTATISASASDEVFMFPIPPKCMVTGGSIRGGVPSGTVGNLVFKVGTREDDDAFGTYTVSGTARTETRLAIYAPVTVSTSDDVNPYQRAVIVTTNSAATSTTSYSLYLLLEYVMPGNI
jgi:hypothetical protein